MGKLGSQVKEANAADIPARFSLTARATE
jgi:hypothetical protein